MNLQQSEAVNCGLGLASMALWDAWAHHVGTLASRADTPLTIVAGGLRCRVQSIILWLSATRRLHKVSATTLQAKRENFSTNDDDNKTTTQIEKLL